LGWLHQVSKCPVDRGEGGEDLGGRGHGGKGRGDAGTGGRGEENQSPRLRVSVSPRPSFSGAAGRSIDLSARRLWERNVPSGRLSSLKPRPRLASAVVPGEPSRDAAAWCNRQKPSDWRPIALSPALFALFHRVLGSPARGAGEGVSSVQFSVFSVQYDLIPFFLCAFAPLREILPGLKRLTPRRKGAKEEGESVSNWRHSQLPGYFGEIPEISGSTILHISDCPI
jgi:hypothetical protein